MHVAPGLAHRLDADIETDEMDAVAAQCEAGGRDRLYCPQSVPLDAGDLHETADRIITVREDEAGVTSEEATVKKP